MSFVLNCFPDSEIWKTDVNFSSRQLVVNATLEIQNIAISENYTLFNELSGQIYRIVGEDSFVPVYDIIPTSFTMTSTGTVFLYYGNSTAIYIMMGNALGT